MINNAINKMEDFLSWGTGDFVKGKPTGRIAKGTLLELERTGNETHVITIGEKLDRCGASIVGITVMVAVAYFFVNSGGGFHLWKSNVIPTDFWKYYGMVAGGSLILVTSPLIVLGALKMFRSASEWIKQKRAQLSEQLDRSTKDLEIWLTEKPDILVLGKKKQRDSLRKALAGQAGSCLIWGTACLILWGIGNHHKWNHSEYAQYVGIGCFGFSAISLSPEMGLALLKGLGAVKDLMAKKQEMPRRSSEAGIELAKP